MEHTANRHSSGSFQLFGDIPGDISNDLLGKKQQPACKERFGKGQYVKERVGMCAGSNQPAIPCWIFPVQNGTI